MDQKRKSFACPYTKIRNKYKMTRVFYTTEHRTPYQMVLEVLSHNGTNARKRSHPPLYVVRYSFNTAECTGWNLDWTKYTKLQHKIHIHVLRIERLMFYPGGPRLRGTARPTDLPISTPSREFGTCV